MLGIGSIVWGVRDVPRAVDFWTAALDYRPRRPLGDDWAILIPRFGSGPQLALSQVDTPPEGHRHHHLDLYASNQEAEVERLVGLGAQRMPDWRYPDDADYVVLGDPDGNLFCVVQV